MLETELQVEMTRYVKLTEGWSGNHRYQIMCAWMGTTRMREMCDFLAAQAVEEQHSDRQPERADGSPYGEGGEAGDNSSEQSMSTKE